MTCFEFSKMFENPHNRKRLQTDKVVLYMYAANIQQLLLSFNFLPCDMLSSVPYVPSTLYLVDKLPIHLLVEGYQTQGYILWICMYDNKPPASHKLMFIFIFQKNCSHGAITRTRKRNTS